MPSPLCPTCFRPVASPFRVTDAAGKIVNGCVDAAHDDKLVPISASASWHGRKEASQIRKRAAKHWGTAVAR